jgi:hypothetical protein
MAIVTKRPNVTVDPGEDWLNDADAVSGFDEAVSDDSNATYIHNPGTDDDIVTMGLPNLTIPDDERMRLYRVRARVRADNDVDPGIAGDTFTMIVTFDPGNRLHPSTRFSEPLQNRFVSGAPVVYDVSSQWTHPGHLVRMPEAPNFDNGIITFENRGPVHARVLEAWVDYDLTARPVMIDFDIYDTTFTPGSPPVHTPVACGGTITNHPFIRMTGSYQYGYSGGPRKRHNARHQYRIFTEEQTDVIGFNPWQVGPWGPPLDERNVLVNQRAIGTTQPIDFGKGLSPVYSRPIPNGEYKVFMRAGTTDYASMGDDVWWSVHEVCAFTMDFPAPAAPPRTSNPSASPAPQVTQGLTPKPPPASPKVTLEVTHNPPSGGSTEWDDPANARIQLEVSWDGGDTWNPVVHRSNGSKLDESDTKTIPDRFVQVSSEAFYPCNSTATEITREALYRVRLFGLAEKVVVITDWVECGPVTVAPCTTGRPCHAHLIDVSTSLNDWSGPSTDESFATIRPFSTAQSASGGLPNVITGAPGGRNHTLHLFVRSSVAVEAITQGVLAAPLFWYIPDDIGLTARWLAPGPDITHTQQKMATPEGPLWELTFIATETGAPGVFFVDLGEFPDEEDE